MRHCRTCRCGEDGDTVTLPSGYLPDGWELQIVGTELIVVNDRGDYDYYWTQRLKKDTEGYKTVRFLD